MTNKKLGFSIILPVYKEKDNILPLTKKILKNLKNHKYEIIFVDDNSKDGSNLILKKLKKKYSFFNPIVRIKKKRDLSLSCIEGIKKSKFNIILVMDGDFQHDPKYIPKIYNKFLKSKADFVVASRDLIYGKNPGLNLFRRITSIVLIFFLSVFNFKTKDPMSGYFMFKKNIFYKNKNKLFAKGYKILADLLINSEKNIKVVDYNIEFKSRLKNRSKMGPLILLILISFYFKYLYKRILNI